MAYYFYLDKILLPIAPAKLELKINNKNKTVDLINYGEVNISKKAGLSDINFDARIPHNKYPFATYKEEFKNAKYFLDEIEKLKNGKPFQFIVSRTSPRGTILFHTNIKATIEEYSVIEDAEDASDITVSIKLKQHRDYATKKIVVSKNDNNSQKPSGSVDNKRPESNNKPKGKTYKVKRGDSLWSICKTQLGDGSKSKYEKVYQLNKELMDSYNKKYGTTKYKYTIYPGQVLQLE
ncbi:LysM peptidoglycan-binding domain-containing protein [Romboutsia lituseburensis]|uniref:LysM peptidoglycan-binding domain-containing protein n=1 Tax=Romboutsia lituseburensis TaxID=1537 RepID=UPI0022EA96CF|nr:LysM peptidoglycan-binding domain-containing protein [Romboutsia lituseburensis]